MRKAKLLKLEICAKVIISKVKSKCFKKTKMIIKYLPGFLEKLKLWGIEDGTQCRYNRE